jgi:hypothetical protein
MSIVLIGTLTGSGPMPLSNILSTVSRDFNNLKSAVGSLLSHRTQAPKPPPSNSQVGYSGASHFDPPAKAPLLDLSGTGSPRAYDTSVFQTIKSHFGNTIHQAAHKYGMGRQGERLITAVMMQESKGNPKATSRAGARGLMQLMPKTAAALGFKPKTLADPSTNIDAGAKYLHQLQGQFGQIGLVAAAYNAGPGAVSHYGGVPPYAETKQYVRNVVSNYVSIP